MFHPWRQLRPMLLIVVEWAWPHPAAPTASDGRARIWLDPRMTRHERRCPLTHELVRSEYGRHGYPPRVVEHTIHPELARRFGHEDATELLRTYAHVLPSDDATLAKLSDGLVP